MKILKQQKKAYHAPYLKCFHHITAEEILEGPSLGGRGQNPDTDESVGDGGISTSNSKQTLFFFEEEEEE